MIIPELYLPEGLKDIPLYQEEADILNWMLNISPIGDYSAVRNKYRDFMSLEADPLREILKELGYDYISDVLFISATWEFRKLVAYAHLIHFLKGHRDGLKLVLELLNPVSFAIQEWWETSPQGEPATYQLFLEFNMSVLGYDAMVRIINFSRNYVYPIVHATVTINTDAVSEGIVMAAFVDEFVYSYVEERPAPWENITSFIQLENNSIWCAENGLGIITEQDIIADPLPQG